MERCDPFAHIMASNAELLELCPLKDLLSHFRFFITLRSSEGIYHSLILFRLTPSSEAGDFAKRINATPKDGSADDHDRRSVNFRERQIYVMESTCPHLGAEMSHAEIEECDSTVIAVCPWHGYDFDMKTGKSETGLKTCTYGVEIRSPVGTKSTSGVEGKKGDTGDSEVVWIEVPQDGSGWRLVELRPVSEEFADPPPTQPPIQPITRETTLPLDPVVPIENPPKTLIGWAVLILNTPHPVLKVERTRHAVHLFRTGQLLSIGHKSESAPRPPDVPPRDENWLRQQAVDPAKLKSTKKNRAVMLHALANIEQWAIDLAWDIVARFGPTHPSLPPSFFSDFTKMALDESKHFTLLTSRLSSISPNTPYGSLPVHASLWLSAQTTSTSLRSRLAIIHLVHEARGLDVNPKTIERFRKMGDGETVDVMEIVHADEVTHVTTGHRWFTWVCEQESKSGCEFVDPVKAFREEVRKGWRGDVKGPFNKEDREKAGLTPEFYENLKGQVGTEVLDRAFEGGKNGATDDVRAKVSVGYDV